MIGMAVIDADQVQASLPRLVVRAKQLQWIDHVPAGSVLHGDVLRSMRLDHARPFPNVAKQEPATLLRECAACMVFDDFGRGLANLDHDSPSQ